MAPKRAAVYLETNVRREARCRNSTGRDKIAVGSVEFIIYKSIVEIDVINELRTFAAAAFHRAGILEKIPEKVADSLSRKHGGGKKGRREGHGS